MERATFLIEASGERLSCMLNPETLEIQRSSGLQTLQSLGGRCAGSGRNEDPVHYAGGGRTELRLDLLFDTTLEGSSLEAKDVRTLTAPLWRLSECEGAAGVAVLPVVRFIWGRNWNVPGVVTAVAERFEHFTAEGDPRRSWISLRFRRINEPDPAPEPPGLTGEEAAALAESLEAGEPGASAPSLPDLPSEGEGNAERRTEPLSVVAERLYGDASWWRLLANLNRLENPVFAPFAQTLQAPDVGNTASSPHPTSPPVSP